MQDQLTDQDNGRALGWLPLDNVPSNVTIVMSTLPEEGGCLQACKDIVKDSNTATFVNVPALVEGDEEEMVNAWLEKDGRSLTPQQMKYLLAQFRKADDVDRTPLLLLVQVYSRF